jgi:hypothetical protein
MNKTIMHVGWARNPAFHANQTAQNWDTAYLLSQLNARAQAREEAAQGQLREAQGSTATV